MSDCVAMSLRSDSVLVSAFVGNVLSIIVWEME